MKLSDMKVDSGRIESGDWVGDLPGLPSLRLKVRGTGNSTYRALQSKLVRAVPAAERIEGLSLAHQESIMTELLLQTVLVDWSGLEDEAGEIKYSPERARELLLDPELRALRDAVATAGDIVANRRKSDLEQAEKN